MAGTDWRLHATQASLEAAKGMLRGLTPPELPAPRGERVMLDPSAVAYNRRQLDITALIGSAGPDWGDAAITQYLAEAGQMGQVAIDFTVPNRTITIPLVIQERGGVSFEQSRTEIQQKVALFQRHGGFIMRSTSIGDVYAEITGATLKYGGSSAQAIFDVDMDAVLTLTTLPDWFGDEILLGITSCTGDGTVIADPIEGDYPARCRVIVTDTSGHDQLGMLASVRSYNYSAESSAQTRYNAADLTGLSGTTVQPLTGSYSGSALRTTIPVTSDPYNPVWQDVLSTQSASTQVDLTHIGSYRVWARVYCPRPNAAATPSVSLRFNWDVGDLVLGAMNLPAEVESYDGFVMVDLGEIRIDRAPVGDHRWQGKVQAMSLHQGAYPLTTLESIAVDRLWFVPVDEGATVLRAIEPTVAVDAVIFSTKTAEVRSDGCWRQSNIGTGYGPVTNVIGDLLRLPPSGLEDLPSEIFLKPTRGCLDTDYPDSGIDSFNVELRYRPCYLFVPGS